MSKPRISYVDPTTVKDPAMIAEFERCAREGTPRPESQAIRAHVPATFWSFANTWRDVFKNGVADHGIKELCRVYVSRSVLCEFCGNQRSIKAAKSGLKEDDYSDLHAQYRAPPDTCRPGRLDGAGLRNAGGPCPLQASRRLLGQDQHERQEQDQH